MGEFAAGLMQGMGKGQQVSQERDFQKQTLDLQKKKFDLEEKESALKMQMLQQQIQQQGGVMGLLEKLLGGQQPGGQGAAPGIETPSMGQPVPPSGAPTQGPAGGFQLGGINISEEGGVGFKLEPPNLQKTEATLDVGGQPTRFQGTFDPRTGQFGQPQAIGPAPVGQRLEQLRAEAASLGFKQGTPEFNDAVGTLGIIEKLPEAQRSLALDQLKSRAAPQGRTGQQTGSFTEQFKKASTLEADRITQETAAREQAKLEFGGLGQEDQKAIETASIGLANARFVLNSFTETEIQAFVGLLQRPTQETKLALKGLGFALGLSGPVMESRFAQFKVANERLRKTAFEAGGKQLTPFEASVVFGFTPTGRETTAAEYLTKVNSYIAFTELGRQARLDLARTSGGKIDPAKLDAMIQQRMQQAGMGAPQRVPQQPGAGTPATAVPGGRLRFNPQTGRIE